MEQQMEKRNDWHKSSLPHPPAGVRPAEQRETNLSEGERGHCSKFTPSLTPSQALHPAGGPSPRQALHPAEGP